MKKLKVRKKTLSNNLLFPVVLFVLVFLGVGFAYVESILQVNGDFTIANNTWDIHFEKGYASSSNITVISSPTISNNTKISLNIKFNDPDTSFYDLYFYAKNDGVVDAHISEINYGIPSSISPYVSYVVTYGDDTDINENDLLKAGDFEQIKISIKLVDNFADVWMETHPEIGTSSEEEDIIATFSGEFTFELKYVQDFGEGYSKKRPSLIQSLKLDKTAIKETPSFTTNPTSSTSGLYVSPDTLSDNYPIYYYRGLTDNVNNNVLFANFCWKIVRTTDRGGVKLIYNGTPNSSKQCTSTGTTSSITFNSNINSLADVGYMYGKRYIAESFSSTTSYIYGNDAMYDTDTKKYTLLDTATTTASVNQSDGIQRHYTCKSSTESTCSNVYYVYTYYNSSAYAYLLTGEKNIDELKELMFTNTTNSSVLNTLNSWYETNILNKGYAGFIDDAIWCNDRTIVSGGLASKDSPLISNVGAYFASYKLDNGGRGLYDTTPNPAINEKDACPNENDQFTTLYASYGNNKLKYPIGLLTADEVTLAGSGYKSYSTTAYLRSGSNLWTMTPAYYGTNSGYNFYYYNNITATSVNTNYYIRPSIVLRPYTKAISGNGTTTSPYVIG